MASAFMKFGKSLEAHRAKAKYEGIPFDVVIKQAKLQDKDAIYYLIARSIKPIISAYKKYYVNNLKLSREESEEQSNDAFNAFLVNLYTLTKKKMGPVFSFKKEKYEQQDDEFMFNKFSFYLYRYFQAVITGLLNRIPKEDSMSVSGNPEDEDYNFIDNVEDEKKEENPLAGQEEFLTYMGVQDPTGALILKLLAKKYSATDIAEELGTSRKFIYAKIDRIGKRYSQFLLQGNNEQ